MYSFFQVSTESYCCEAIYSPLRGLCSTYCFGELTLLNCPKGHLENFWKSLIIRSPLVFIYYLITMLYFTSLQEQNWHMKLSWHSSAGRESAWSHIMRNTVEFSLNSKLRLNKFVKLATLAKNIKHWPKLCCGLNPGSRIISLMLS